MIAECFLLSASLCQAAYAPVQGWRKEPAHATLSTTLLATATLDTWSTQRAIRRGYDESNPLARPFVKPSALHWTATYVGAVGVNWLALRMKRSQRWYRRIWWLPQTVAITANLWGIQRNLRIPGRNPCPLSTRCPR